MRRFFAAFLGALALLLAATPGFTGTLYDLVRMTSPTTGANNVVALGTALPGFLSFSGAGVPDGSSVSVAISDNGGSPAQSLTGRGTYSAGSQTITITQITASTNNGAMIPLSGSAQIAISAISEDIETIVSGPIGANTYVGNTSNSSASAQQVAWPSCPDQSGAHLNYVNGSGVACGSSAPPPSSPITISANYALQPANCPGTIYLSGALLQLTLPGSTSGFSPGCEITIVNGSTTRAQTLLGFPSTLPSGCGAACLQPTKTLKVMATAAGWLVTKEPGRLRVTSPPTIYVNASSSPIGGMGAGSDSNDGWSALAPLKNMQTAIYFFQSGIDFGASTLNEGTIQAACNTDASPVTYPEGLLIFGPLTGADGFSILGNTSDFDSCRIEGPPNSHTIQDKDLAIVTIKGFQLLTQTLGFSIFDIGWGGTIDYGNVDFNAATGGAQININNGGTANATAPYTISAGAGSHIQVSGSGSIAVQDATPVSIPNPIVFSNGFVNAVNSASIIFEVNTSFPGASVTGLQYNVSGCASLALSGTTLPGSGTSPGSCSSVIP